MIELFDGPILERNKPMKKICSPSIKHARDSSGKFQLYQTFLSSGNILSLLFRRFAALSSQPEQEFIDGAYVFHDEHIGGTLQPDTLCNVDYYGMSAASRGTINNSGNQHFFWNVEGSLECIHRFIPAANQSVVIQIISLTRNQSESQCYTLCGDRGCQCMTTSLPLSQFDHLKIVTDSGLLLSCICGGFKEEWLPVGIRSWSSVKVVYSLAHYSWTMKGFSFQAQ
ncbi:uncharacterized protein LOC142318047 [Lycorma delicatula]|uniref:uncharacterized protein LOC142318047 n=1 Tax=Lycorma delicatula TaxID=130591 RepID=UPI003F515004